MYIKPKAILHYLIIYLMIACGGTAWTSFMGNNQFVLLCFFCPLILIIQRHGIDKKFLCMFGLYTFFCFLAFMYSSLSVGTYMNVGGKLLVSYVALTYDRNNFLKRFLNISLVLCFSSLIIYVITQIIGFDNLRFIYTKFYTNPADGSYILGNGYGLFLYRFVPLHSIRNCGMFTEPGEHAIYLCVLMYMLLVHTNKAEFHQKNLLMVVVILDLVTCQSTSGYIILFLLIILSIFSRKINFEFNTKWRILISIVIVLSFSYLQSIFASVVTEKMFSHGSLDLNQGTAGVRTLSIIDILQYIRNDWTSILGIGFEKIQQAGIEACSGLLITLLAVGIFAFLTIYIFMLRLAWKNKVNSTDFIMQLVILFLGGLSQPGLAFPIMLIMNMYSEYCKYKEFCM